MLSTKQYLMALLEGKHDPENEGHRQKLLDLDHSEISKNKNSSKYEDKVANALKGLRSDVHGKEHVRKYLEKFHNTPNRWVRIHVAKHPELHDHPDLHKTMLNDESPRIREFAAAERKALKPTETKPKVETPVKKKIPTKPKSETPKKKIPTKSKGLSVKEGDVDDFPYASKVSHIVDHKGRHVGTVVSGSRPSEMGSDEPFHHSYTGDYERTGLEHHGRHESHPHALLSLVKKLKGE